MFNSCYAHFVMHSWRCVCVTSCYHARWCYDAFPTMFWQNACAAVTHYQALHVMLWRWRFIIAVGSDHWMTNRLNAFIESMDVICCIHSRLAEEAILFAAWKLIWYVQKKRPHLWASVWWEAKCWTGLPSIWRVHTGIHVADVRLQASSKRNYWGHWSCRLKLYAGLSQTRAFEVKASMTKAKLEVETPVGGNLVLCMSTGCRG